MSRLHCCGFDSTIIVGAPLSMGHIVGVTMVADRHLISFLRHKVWGYVGYKEDFCGTRYLCAEYMQYAHTFFCVCCFYISICSADVLPD